MGIGYVEVDGVYIEKGMGCVWKVMECVQCDGVSGDMRCV